MVDRRLYLHLATWLGQWPPRQPFQVVRSHRRISPAWDGRTRPAVAVAAPEGTVLSVPPPRVEPVRRLATRCGALPAPVGRPLDRLLAELPAAVGFDDWPVHRGVFRWTLAPTPLPDAGRWVSPAEADLPSWLRWFDREVLVVRDDTGGYLAGVGIKRHDAYGHELAVGTAPHARGRGLARRLTAQAARRVLDEGAVPIYQHDPGNAASARVAEAAGFAERGWRSYGVFPD
ncbi:GNAT family N-acetyltransferase [Micromonospora sp. CPCC 206060]|uniref:GNAT family N-acetyltransferase n=1 Tax=Micromonospora sp. CPCC 206060 TaxID=3122406 RepID=UPI002FF1E982